MEGKQIQKIQGQLNVLKIDLYHLKLKTIKFPLKVFVVNGSIWTDIYEISTVVNIPNSKLDNLPQYVFANCSYENNNQLFNSVVINEFGLHLLFDNLKSTNAKRILNVVDYYISQYVHEILTESIPIQGGQVVVDRFN